MFRASAKKQVPSKPGRENNFNIIRLVAALCVMSGHMSLITGTAPMRFAGADIHAVGVSIFFMIAGYLIAKSWESDPHPLRYLFKRFTRIWPPLAVYVLIMVYIIGPLMTDYSVHDYFHCWYTNYLRNLRFSIFYGLPGVLESPALPQSRILNGSLWTLPVEVFCYFLCPIILSLLRLIKKPKARCGLQIALALAVGAAEVLRRALVPEQEWVFYETDWARALYLIGYFLMGMIYANPGIKKYLSIQWGALVILFMAATQFGSPVQTFLLMITLPYFIFSFALADKPRFARFGTKYELSYGLYLYGFFFQQLVEWYNILDGIWMSFMRLLLISLVPTVIAAWLSCVLIEKPLLRLTGRLCAKWRDAEAAWLEKRRKAKQPA